MRRKTLVLGHCRKKGAESRGLIVVESGGELVLVLASETGDLAHQLFSRLREVDGVPAAITGIAATLDVPTLLELVQVGDQAPGRQAQVGAEVMLAAAGICRDGTQDARVCRAQLKSRELFGEHRGGVKAQLAQQKADAAGVIICGQSPHAWIIA